MRVRTVLMTMTAALLLLTRPDAQVLGEKPSDHWADIAQGQLPEAFAVFTAATVNGIVVGPSGFVSFVDATGATIHAPAPLPLATEVTLPPGFVTPGWKQRGGEVPPVGCRCRIRARFSSP